MNPVPYKTVDKKKERDWASVVRGKDIVIVGLQPWYFETGCNCKNIAAQFANECRVLYVNFPIKRKAFLAKTPEPKIARHISVIREKDEQIRQVAPNIWEFYPSSLIESVNWLPTTWAFRIVNYFNNRRFARDIRNAMEKLEFKDFIVFNDNDIYNGFHLKELLRPSLYIYYLRDFLQGYDYWKKHTSVLEPELIRKSDVVVANSQFYADYSLHYNKNSYYIGQGCSFEYFNHTCTFPIPDDLAANGKPLIGYVGALDASRLDLNIIEQVALSHPAWNVVLVGPEDDTFKQSRLHQIPNIHFLGGKPFGMLPAYVNAFDVCINPQLNNEITKGNYPLKVDEYLAMGKPVVATRTQAMSIFEEYTYLAANPFEYAGLIEKALTEDSPQKQAERIAFAQGHTWENSVAELYKAIDLSIIN